MPIHHDNPHPVKSKDSNTSTSPSLSTGTDALPSKFYWTDGWYLVIWSGTCIALANTRLAPYLFGITTIAIIYQLNNWIQGK